MFIALGNAAFEQRHDKVLDYKLQRTIGTSAPWRLICIEPGEFWDMSCISCH